MPISHIVEFWYQGTGMITPKQQSCKQQEGWPHLRHEELSKWRKKNMIKFTLIVSDSFPFGIIRRPSESFRNFLLFDLFKQSSVEICTRNSKIDTLKMTENDVPEDVYISKSSYLGQDGNPCPLIFLYLYPICFHHTVNVGLNACS